MAKKISITGKPARQIEVTGKPYRRIEPEEFARALGAEAVNDSHAPTSKRKNRAASRACTTKPPES